ncbi:hypothetical protein FLL45_06055 [Aliikangiella marina]|uniref:Copper chaperone PCu(A)C n=1 Tax=Aliikangiella marina TaxID=1712262 RepID=A0A545TJV2_9GAMM|nr:hypothetical protein [Aliikangiella marina]TQV77504.1 hypothetical protein FLL45_06055 [Aliikangiella marina]
MLRAFFVVITLCLFQSSLHAQEPYNALTVDHPIPSFGEYSFPNDQKIQPAKSDFHIENVITMSNPEGERWAAVTLTNQSAGQRIFKPNQLLALFADGQRLFPMSQEHTFDARERVTLTLYFGENNFPILSIYTRR